MTLDDIKRDIGHDEGCDIRARCEFIGPGPECNCTRRDKIAFLERLQEPPRELLVSMALQLHHDFLASMKMNGK